MIEKKIDTSHDLTIFTVKEHFDLKEVSDQIVNFHKESPTLWVIWDFRGIKIPDLSRKQIRKIAVLTFSADTTWKKRKTALVFSRNLDYGIGKIFEALAEMKHPLVSFSVFRDMDDAYKWLEIEKNSQ